MLYLFFQYDDSMERFCEKIELKYCLNFYNNTLDLLNTQVDRANSFIFNPRRIIEVFLHSGCLRKCIPLIKNLAELFECVFLDEEQFKRFSKRQIQIVKKLLLLGLFIVIVGWILQDKLQYIVIVFYYIINFILCFQTCLVKHPIIF